MLQLHVQRGQMLTMFMYTCIHGNRDRPRERHTEQRRERHRDRESKVLVIPLSARLLALCVSSTAG